MERGYYSAYIHSPENITKVKSAALSFGLGRCRGKVQSLARGNKKKKENMIRWEATLEGKKRNLFLPQMTDQN